MRIHKLKTWSEYFPDIVSGKKTFEVRKNDRQFNEADALMLKEWDKDKGDYTGNVAMVLVTYILEGGQFGIKEGHCVMGIKMMPPEWQFVETKA